MVTFYNHKTLKGFPLEKHPFSVDAFISDYTSHGGGWGVLNLPPCPFAGLYFRFIHTEVILDILELINTQYVHSTLLTVLYSP